MSRTEPSLYEALPTELRRYVDVLVSHAETALWPERRVALSSFWRGISRSDPADHRSVVAVLGLELAEETDPAEAVFRVVLTAYLEQLAQEAVTNPDQAVLFRLSLDPGWQALAERWFAENPDHPEAGS